ncbi:murein L,D-transpeptidase catalytic domain-containing protein [Chitinophagaceae bacterium MMS25-I14]
MSKTFLSILAGILLFAAGAAAWFLPRYTRYHLPLPVIHNTTAEEKEQDETMLRLKHHAALLHQYAAANGYATSVCFLADMGRDCGHNRFFVYNPERDTLLAAGLVAHGAGGKKFALTPRFSNKIGSGCTSLGRYRIRGKYQGNYSMSYKLTGLDSTNSNAFARYVVLHAYTCVPDEEPYPQPICNSLGCPMVSNRFLNLLSQYIDTSSKPVLLWIYR